MEYKIKNCSILYLLTLSYVTLKFVIKSEKFKCNKKAKTEEIRRGEIPFHRTVLFNWMEKNARAALGSVLC